MMGLHHTPLVSIIMPTYNRAALIGETIDSILAQTLGNWELIIVDDGSTDDTAYLVGQLKEPRIKFIPIAHTGIGGKVKNAGLTMVKGAFIAFIDSDDCWAPDKLEKQVAALNKETAAGFCLTNGYNFKEKGTAVDFFYQQKEGSYCAELFIDLFRSKVAAFAQALLFRKDCLAKTRLFIEEKSFSDIDFIISLAAHYNGVILYEPLVFRRLHDSNYITDNWEKSCEEGIDIIKSHSAQLPAAVARRALFIAYMNFGEKYLVNGHHRKSIASFCRGWQYKPFSVAPIKKTAKTLLHYLKTI